MTLWNSYLLIINPPSKHSLIETSYKFFWHIKNENVLYSKNNKKSFMEFIYSCIALRNETILSRG